MVPMGSSGWPIRDQVAPSSDSRPTRLTSAMPSSTCWPVSLSAQWIRASVSPENQSARWRVFQMPTLLIQPPRLVDDATSGLTVTTRSATEGASRARASKKRPSVCCVVRVR